MPVGLPAERLKVAQILVAIGPERAAKMLAQLPEDRVQAIVADMAAVELAPDEAKEVLTSFTRDFLQRKAAPAGLDLAKKVLANLYSGDKADQVARAIDPRNTQPFGWMRLLEANDIATALASEPPATSAVALAHLPANFAAKILRKMADPKRSDVALRVASLRTVAPDVVAAIDASLRGRIVGQKSTTEQRVEGVSLLVDVLTQSSPKIQKAIVASIREHNDKLAVQILEQLFIFDDIVQLDDKAVQQLLRSIESMDLAFALYDASEPIKDLIFRNLSERARDSLIEEIDYLQSPKAPEIKSARARIVAVIRDLEEAGTITIDRPGAVDEEDDDDDDGAESAATVEASAAGQNSADDSADDSDAGSEGGS